MVVTQFIRRVWLLWSKRATGFAREERRVAAVGGSGGAAGAEIGSGGATVGPGSGRTLDSQTVLGAGFVFRLRGFDRLDVVTVVSSAYRAFRA